MNSNREHVRYSKSTDTYIVSAEAMAALSNHFNSFDEVADALIESGALSMIDAKTVENLKNLMQVHNPIARDIVLAVANPTSDFPNGQPVDVSEDECKHEYTRPFSKDDQRHMCVSSGCLAFPVAPGSAND